MSHYTRLTTAFSDANIISKAATRMGYPLKENALCRGWNGQTQQCDLVLPLPEGYDVGFQKEGNVYAVYADFYEEHIRKYLGSSDSKVISEIGEENSYLCRFQDAYNRELIETAAQAQGYMVSESIAQDGSTRLELVPCY